MAKQKQSEQDFDNLGGCLFCILMETAPSNMHTLP
jgi:hypothetical protein